jgi:hypothetical protein
MSDLLFQNISSVQNSTQLKPPTIAAAATIAPTHGLTFVSGTTDVATITPPVTGYHLLTLIFTNASPGDILTTGNVLVGTTTVTQNVPVLLFYDPNQFKYYPKN